MRKILCLFLLLCGCNPKQGDCPCRQKVGLCVVATGNYLDLAKEMIASARAYFCKEYEVTYFLFTDGTVEERADVVTIPWARQGWPLDTLKRFYAYDAAQDLLSSMDYLYAIDADMRFVAPVSSEIFGATVGCARDVGKHRTYEKDKCSAAYLSKKKAQAFYAGAFYGGERKKFFKMIRSLKQAVEHDIQTGHVSKLYDEAYLNRYFYDHPPRLTLNSSYCYPEDYDLPYERKILAVTKNHQKYQIAAE